MIPKPNQKAVLIIMPQCPVCTFRMDCTFNDAKGTHAIVSQPKACPKGEDCPAVPAFKAMLETHRKKDDN